MELIAKISRGTLMNQIYLPKNKTELEPGTFVVITKLEKPLQEIEKIKAKAETNNLFFYNSKEIEPIKIKIIKEITNIIDNEINNDNLIITGSFLENGFNFNDIDILLITSKKANEKHLEKIIESKIGIKTHILLMSNEELKEGLSNDPLYRLMLSKCISKRRLIFNIKIKIIPKLLDIHLLKSEPLIHSFDALSGKDKYYLIRNLIAIKLFLENKKITKSNIDNEIISIFQLKNIDAIVNNMLDKTHFMSTFKKLYKETQNKIFSVMKNK